MNWLDFDFKESKSLEIGSRMQFSSHKDDVSVWEKDIYEFMKAMKMTLKNNGVMAIIIGDSVIDKRIFNALNCVKRIAKNLNLKYLYSTSTPLLKNTKMFNHKWRTKLEKNEHMISLQKK